jgi:serine/threonine protein kinase
MSSSSSWLREATQKTQDAAKAAAQKAQDAALNAAQRAQDAANRMDLPALQQRAQQKAATAAKSLSGMLTRKEVISIEGHVLRLERILGEGGFGYIYLARHEKTGEEYAVKRMIAQDSESREMALAECSLLRSLEHPNIVTLLASCHSPRDAGGVEFLLLLELATRGTLARWVTPDAVSGAMPARIDEERLLTCFHDACKGVAFMHSRHIAHRDLKLENVLETGRGVCKLCDFGSATTRTLDPRTATRKQRVDEEEYVSRYSTMMNRSPEMVDLSPERGVVGIACDCWALGCMLFTLAFQRRMLHRLRRLEPKSAPHWWKDTAHASEDSHPAARAPSCCDRSVRWGRGRGHDFGHSQRSLHRSAGLLCWRWRDYPQGARF